MRAAFLLLPLMLAACGTQESLNKVDGKAAPADEPSVPVQAVQTATLTGLYEGGPAEARSQVCVVERGTGNARFGLVVRAAGGQSCAGSGVAVRQGAAVRLTMEGDERCMIDGHLDGTRLTLSGQLPAGCAYYCSRGASLAGQAFDKTGGSAEDAMRATDLVGDRLCAGLG